MDRVVREIFRSWNWPHDTLKRFSQRPTPYNVSKYCNISPSSVYTKWNELFSRDYVKKVILLPADSLVERRLVFMTGMGKTDLEALKSRFNQLYYLEMVHTGHIYDAGGSLAPLKTSNDITILEIVGLSEELAQKQLLILLELINKEAKVIFSLPVIYGPDNGFSGEKEELAGKIAYRDIAEIDIPALSRTLNRSAKTVSRKLDEIAGMGLISAFPVLHQGAFANINSFVVSLPAFGTETSIEILHRALTLGTISERYLLYRFFSGGVNLMLYYDTPSELDQCVDEIASNFHDYSVAIRFETHFNEHVENSMNRKATEGKEKVSAGN